MKSSDLHAEAWALLLAHARRYPAWCVVDAYKLLYQACMGPRHAAEEPETLRQHFQARWQSARPDASGPLLEDIGLVAPLWRLHFAPARARGISAEEAVEAFLRCIESFAPRRGLLLELWNEACLRIREGSLPVADRDALDEVDRRLRAGGFPAVSHSEAFRAAYEPAYCLVCDDAAFGA